MNTYTCDTTVGAGTLEVGGAAHPLASLQIDVLVDAGGMLRGHGTITGIVANNGGIVRPGGSIGTLTIFGDYTQSPTGTLMIDVSPTVASQLNVEGTATLGGTLQLVYGPGTYTTKTSTIVKGSPLTGKFPNIKQKKTK